MVPTKEAFAARWMPVTETGCWLWTGNWMVKGYGVFQRGATALRAHRVSWELHKGSIPEGLFVCHKCDTRCCVNPDHLFLGTIADNGADMRAKGRDRASYGHRLLTEDQVREIRNLCDHRWMPQRRIAQKFGVTQSCVNAIARGRSWTHLLEPQ